MHFAGFAWTRDKANRHFFFSGDTGAGKTSGMNILLEDSQCEIHNHPGEVKVHLTEKGAGFETTATNLAPDRLPEVRALCEFPMQRLNGVVANAGAELLRKNGKLGTLTFRVH